MTQQDQTQAIPSQGAGFRDEELHLASVVGSIDTKIQSGDNMGPFMAGTPQAADILKGRHETNQRRAQAVRDRPYFGRIDLTTSSEAGELTVYIGDENLNNENPRYLIASRSAPIAALYFNPASGSYQEPSGRVEAKVGLKRLLTINDAKLEAIEDVIGLARGTARRGTTRSRILTEKLSTASEFLLADVIQTIQPAQYEQIAAIDKPVIIVQGAAGSGKSLIGLYRIDFMLSPHSYIGGLTRPAPERTIMFGPSNAFLRYVSGLLPGLGVERVRQNTLSEWLQGQLPRGMTLSKRDKIFDDLMNNRRRLMPGEIEAHRFKTELKMKRVLDSLVNSLRRRILESVRESRGITFAGSPPLELDSTSFSARVAGAFRVFPQPNRARLYFANGIAEEWADSHSRRATQRNEAIAEARGIIEAALAPIWPRIDVRTQYMDLIRSPNRLLEHSRKGALDVSRARQISRTAPAGAGRALGLTDLPAVIYLNYSLNSFESERFEHIVVDEAQDVSPLEMSLLKMHSATGVFTILGDLRQGILPYKSITNWNQLASLFDRGDVSRLESRQTYRSTRQITQYANRILHGLPSRAKMPEPYDRGGTRPQLLASKTASGMRIAIADSIRRLSGLDNIRSVAVLTKWQKTARDIAAALEDEGIGNVGILSPDGVIQSDVIISPIVLTKGLEFDAVIVANARKDNFLETELDRMLFYLACTRARHHLEIYWYGNRSPIVPEVSRLNQYRDAA